MRALTRLVIGGFASLLLSASVHAIPPLTAQPEAVDPDYAKTRYPVVLVHGLFGYDTTAQGHMQYWYQIPEALQASGAKVYVATVTAVQSSEARGRELLAQLETILATDFPGGTRFNLIGHSHGGPTARFVAHERPGLVASVTSIGSPHFGSPVADLAVSSPGPVRDNVAYAFVEAVGRIIAMGSDHPNEYNEQNARDSMKSLSTEGSMEFNRKYPWGLPHDGQGNPVNPCESPDYLPGAGSVDTPQGPIRFYSYTGVTPLTNPLDPADAALEITSLAFEGRPNDGMVAACSAIFGRFLGVYGMNHQDEINQSNGLVSPQEKSPVVVLRAHVNRLKRSGL